MPTNQPSYRPFSNGTEFMIWCERNCEQCIKGPPADIQGPNENCEIENALTLAASAEARSMIRSLEDWRWRKAWRSD